MEKEEVLKNLGLTDKEAKTYVSILELGSSTIKPIADKAGIKRTSIYNFIDRLVELGLVSQSKVHNRMHYQALTPQRLVQLEQQRLSSIEQALPEFLGMFNVPLNKPRIEYYEGPEQIKNIVKEELRCSKEALYIWTGKDILEMIGGVKVMSEIDRQRIQKGIFIKTVRFRDKDIPYPYSAHGTKFLRQLRFAPKDINIPMAIGIYDTGKVGFFGTKQEGFGILITSKELQQSMTVFHQLLWEKSKEAKPGEG